MTPPSRRLVGVLALVLATQGFLACNAGMRLGADEGTVVAPPKPEAAPTEGAAAESAASPDDDADEAEGETPAETPPKAEDAPEAEAEEEDEAEEETEAAAPVTSDCISSKCHTTILSKAVVHDAAEGCTDCHEEVSTPHPSKGVKTFKLTQDMPDLCSTCHDEYGKMKTVHSPVADGACTDCHDPHSTTEEKLLIKSVGEVCADCHESQTDYPNLHGPVSDGDCIACHNPHETDTTALLLLEGTALCLDCHSELEDVMQKKVVHAPLEDGCISCHDPHGSKFAKLLSDDGKAVCAECHTEVTDAIDTAEVPHAAMEDDAGCMLCHSPHSSDHGALLVKSAREVCMECHEDAMPAKSAVLHGKGNSGDCADCHSPHGGALEALLVAAYPEGKYQVYSETAYPLCFSCHERDLVASEETSTATGFRDGKKNLHAIHVDDGEKGRSCTFCHSLHGSSNPKLIQDSVAFGKWKLNLKFMKTETGGGCAPGCHKPLYYDRERAGRRPPNAVTARPASDFAP